MDKFKVGQKVRYVGLVNNYSDNGKIATVTEQRNIRIYDDSTTDFSYQVDETYYVKECFLEPVYDGDEKSNWSECAWKPKEKIVG